MRGLLKAYGIKRVFILGTGFSAPLGLPLTRDLLRLAYGVAEGNPWYLEGGQCSLLAALGIPPILAVRKRALRRERVIEGETMGSSAKSSPNAWRAESR